MRLPWALKGKAETEERGLGEQKEKYQPKRAKEKPSKARKSKSQPPEPVNPAGPGNKSLAQKNKKKKHLWPAIAALVLVLLLAGGYSAACALVDTDTILPKTMVNGVDLSGMSQEEAANALSEDFHARYDNAQLSVTANGETYTVEVGNALEMDCGALATETLKGGQTVFLTRAFHFAKAKLLGSNREVYPVLGDADALQEAIKASGLLEIDTTVQTKYDVTEDELILIKGVTGNSVDAEALTTQISEAIAVGDYDTVLDCPMVTGTVDDIDWDAIEDEVCRESSDATLKLDDSRTEYEIVESVTAVSFDREKAEEALKNAEEGSSVQVELVYTEPEITTEDLEENLFINKLSSYTTKVGGTSNRISNVRLAAQKCNGIILLNGDTFSYNDTLGERTAANGFKTAAAYLNGQTVQEYGGGICQISSTLYAATLYANLSIVERRNHTYASDYIGLGLDATVSWGGPDFQFSNNKKYPIKIEASYYGGYATVTIWGTKTDDTYVEIESETLQTIPFNTVYKNDSSMYKGETYTSQNGADGYKVQTYRKVYDGDGTLISNEKEAYSEYSTHDRIIYQGTKEKEKPKQSNAGNSTQTSGTGTANSGTTGSQTAGTTETTETTGTAGTSGTGTSGNSTASADGTAGNAG